MQYHAPTDQFTLSAAEMRSSDWAEYAEGGILDAARALGIDLGADRPGKLDVSQYG
jgi:hypothetical protein